MQAQAQYWREAAEGTKNLLTNVYRYDGASMRTSESKCLDEGGYSKPKCSGKKMDVLTAQSALETQMHALQAKLEERIVHMIEDIHGLRTQVGKLMEQMRSCDACVALKHEDHMVASDEEDMHTKVKVQEGLVM